MMTREDEQPDVTTCDVDHLGEEEVSRPLSAAEHELEEVASQIADDLDREITSGLLEEEIDLIEDDDDEEPSCDLDEAAVEESAHEPLPDETPEAEHEGEAKVDEEEGAQSRGRHSDAGGLVSVAGLAIVLAFLLGLTLSGQSFLSLPPTLAAVSLLFVTSVAFTWHLHRTWLQSVLEWRASISRSLQEKPAGASPDDARPGSSEELSFRHITEVMKSRLASGLDEADEAVRRERQGAASQAGGPELDRQLCSEIDRREEMLREKILAHVEKISVFFESLLEKHVFRLNRELREKEKEIEALREEAQSDKQKVAELMTLEEKVAQLEAELALRDGDAWTASGEESPRRPSGEQHPPLFESLRQQLERRIESAKRVVERISPEEESQESESSSARGTEDPAVRDAACEILSELTDAQRLLNRVADLERLKSSEWKVERAPVDVKDVLKTVREGLRREIRERRIQVTTKVAPELDSIVTDRELLEMALREVLGNAVAFSRKGGRIDLLAHRVEETGDGPGRARITVRDSGPGIPSRQRERFLKAFETGGSQTPEAGEGRAGLGLPLAKACTERLDGELRIESRPGKAKGIQIVFELPLAPAS
ncbi:MAG: hypothetical protein JXA90_11500 [Planctomycetes bacterium]|nr:hypothetical protein [Planctomycetota bacterium]